MLSVLPRFLRRLVLGGSICALALLVVVAVHISGQAQTTPAFASRIEQFSEPGGYFDTDNLISNERSYLHPLGAGLRQHLCGAIARAARRRI